MAYYNRRYYKRSSHKSKNVGREIALKHIEEGKALSTELGGSDNEVKAFLFSLSPSEFQPIMDHYEKQYGRDARSYAEATMPRWKTGRCQMSGLVASRLFSLIPPYMPLENKYKVVETLWNKSCPFSEKTIYAGPYCNDQELLEYVKEYLKKQIIAYKIPDSIEQRFFWLANSDVTIYQQLLSHWFSYQSELASNHANIELPVLLAHLRNNGPITTRISKYIQIGNHKIEIIFDPKIESKTIAERNPISLNIGRSITDKTVSHNVYSNNSYSNTPKSSNHNNNTLLFGLLILVGLYFVFSSSNSASLNKNNTATKQYPNISLITKNNDLKHIDQATPTNYIPEEKPPILTKRLPTIIPTKQRSEVPQEKHDIVIERSQNVQSKQNLKTCLNGKYKSLCDKSKLSPDELVLAEKAEIRENLQTCLKGKYKSLCDKSRLTSAQEKQVEEAETKVNLEGCLKGKYKSLCDKSKLSAQELLQTELAEQKENVKLCLGRYSYGLCDKELLKKTSNEHPELLSK